MTVSKNLDPRDALYIELITRRSDAVSEEDIASALGFESPKELYRRLAWDGFPICAWCGTAFATEEHCEQAQAEGRRERSALFVGGPMNMLLSDYATRLMTELAAIGLDPEGRREAWELAYPPEDESGDVREIQLSNGQVLLLALDAYREEPFNDERWSQRRQLLQWHSQFIAR